LHCDRDQVGSAYAPVSTTELNSADLDGWLLGHIHAPDPLTAEHPAGYLGSVTGLDPGEPGARGPWLITIEDGVIASTEQWTLASLRWERLTVDLTGIEFPEDARERLLNATNELDQTLLGHAMSPEAAGLRVTFTGRTNMHRKLEEVFEKENLNELRVGTGRIHYFVERLRYDIQPELDMATLAQRADPPGLLARRIQILDRPLDDAERRALLEAARRHLAERAKKPYWGPLDDSTQEDEALTGWLRRSGLAALAQLLAQREGAE
jgi:DNA repair exonuclease SbcCD nuclease subunit